MTDENDLVDRQWNNVKVTGGFPVLPKDGQKPEVLEMKMPVYRAAITYENSETGETLGTVSVSGSARFVERTVAGSADAFVEDMER